MNSSQGNLNFNAAVDLTATLAPWNVSYTFGGNGMFFCSVEIGSQTNPQVNVRMANSGAATATSRIVGVFGHNGGGAERNWAPCTVPVHTGNSVFLEKTGGGYATLTTAIFVPYI